MLNNNLFRRIFMKKLLYKLCLCGILIGSINYELAYSTTAPQQTVEEQFTSQIILNNNQVTGTLDNNITIQGSNNIIGQYDTSKFYIENNTIYPMFCELDPGAGDYGIFVDGNSNALPVPYTAKITYTDNKEYYVFPICSGYYKWYLSSNINYLEVDSNPYYCVGIEQYTKTVQYQNTIPYANDIATKTVQGYNKQYNIMCVKIDNIYTLSEDKTKILYNTQLYKYDQTDQKWYKTDEDSNYIIKEGTEDEKVEISKSKLIIPSQYKLTLSEPEGGGGG